MLMARLIKEIIRMVKGMAKGHMFGIMDQLIKETGRMVISMEQEYILLLMG